MTVAGEFVTRQLDGNDEDHHANDEEGGESEAETAQPFPGGEPEGRADSENGDMQIDVNEVAVVGLGRCVGLRDTKNGPHRPDVDGAQKDDREDGDCRLQCRRSRLARGMLHAGNLVGDAGLAQAKGPANWQGLSRSITEGNAGQASLARIDAMTSSTVATRQLAHSLLSRCHFM